MKRRDLLRSSVSVAAGLALGKRASALYPRQPASSPAPVKPIPIIDAHIHLFDPSRPGGVPWPEKDDMVLYKPALPSRYSAMVEGLGVVGAIAIEASPLLSDNDWLLGIAQANPIMVGIIGDLVPSDTDFSKQLVKLHANPLFLGIRYGNLWKRDLTADIRKPGFAEGLKRLSEAGLVFESANPDLNLVRGIVQVADHYPNLRIVIDHLPHAPVPEDAAERKEYWALLSRLGKNRNVFAKLSEIPVVAEGRVIIAPSYYRPGLDRLWGIFGEDKVIFGSDWPNGDHVAGFSQTLEIVRAYAATKSETAQQKYFWKNSAAAYKWAARLPDQPSIS
jgi:predicted TIM-barrel fold metal-dependent hydrolase